MAYSYSQLGKLAKDVGIPTNKLQVIAHIALAESDGDPNARSPKTGYYTEADVAAGRVVRSAIGTADIGLWQINTMHKEWSEQSLLDPHTNAVAMSVLSKNGQDLTPWNSSKKNWQKDSGGVLNSIVPLSNLGGVAGNIVPGTAADYPIIGPVVKAGDAVTGAVDTAAGIAGSYMQFMVKSYAWLGNSHNWLRILYVILGGGVAIMGVAKLVAYDGGLLPTGALLKAAKGIPSGKVAA